MVEVEIAGELAGDCRPAMERFSLFMAATCSEDSLKICILQRWRMEGDAVNEKGFDPIQSFDEGGSICVYSPNQEKGFDQICGWKGQIYEESRPAAMNLLNRASAGSFDPKDSTFGSDLDGVNIGSNRRFGLASAPIPWILRVAAKSTTKIPNLGWGDQDLAMAMVVEGQLG